MSDTRAERQIPTTGGHPDNDPGLDNEFFVQARMYSARELFRLAEFVKNRRQLKPYEINCGD
jgi:hypothetical protein